MRVRERPGSRVRTPLVARILHQQFPFRRHFTSPAGIPLMDYPPTSLKPGLESSQFAAFLAPQFCTILCKISQQRTASAAKSGPPTRDLRRPSLPHTRGPPLGRDGGRHGARFGEGQRAGFLAWDGAGANADVHGDGPPLALLGGGVRDGVRVDGRFWSHRRTRLFVSMSLKYLLA